jgi:hypothetical protein
MNELNEIDWRIEAPKTHRLEIYIENEEWRT